MARVFVRMCSFVIMSLVAHHHPPFVCQVRVVVAFRIYGFEKKMKLDSCKDVL